MQQPWLARRHLLTRVIGSVYHDSSPYTETQDTIDARRPAIAQIQASSRPLLLGEVGQSGRDQRRRLSRYLNTHTEDDYGDALIIPGRAQGKMIGLLALGERGNHQQYAGPDFEIAQLLLNRYSSILETARLYRKAKVSADLQNSLYQASLLRSSIFQTAEELAIGYAQTASEAVNGLAEIWMYDATQQGLRRISSPEQRLSFIEGETLTLQEEDWQPCFFSVSQKEEQVENTTPLPSCLPVPPRTSLAWLPLNSGEQHLGVIVISYPHMHVFFEEEKRIWLMFANRSAIALENIRITIALRAAYERQKELDALKDQFIMTASHELRTPLTAVQGYIELLKEHDTTLSPEMRAHFIARAHRGCDELTLMVGNIMDASRVHIDAENIHLSTISLLDSVSHVLEILDAVLRVEQRKVVIDVAPELQVAADDLRLRQILLNLVNNAQKYAPVGTPIEIAAHQDEQVVTVSVRDYGSGILPEEHERLFERFVRMERDMNSPVRGAGLGLYICRKLTRAMGGDIWIESTGEEGKGSTFFFTLCAVAQQQQQSIINSVSLS